MMDFTGYGTVSLYRDYTEMGDDVLQFTPEGNNSQERESNLKTMLKIFDDALPTISKLKARGILIQRDKRYPVPCIILFKNA